MSGDSIRSAVLTAVLLVVLLPCRSVMGASVENDIVEFVKKVYGDCEVQVTFNRVPQSVKAAKRIKNIGFSKMPDDTGDGICLVGIEGQGGAETNVYLPFRVQIRRQIYALKSNMNKGDVIRLADLSVKETYLQGSSANYPTGTEEIVGKAVKKDVTAGQILTRQILQEQMMVARGEIVNMTVENKRLIVQAKGIALEKGAIGDLVRVKSASGKEIVGRVTGSSSVSVEF